MRKLEVEKNITINGWEVVTIGDIIKFSSGKSRPKNTSKEKTEEFNIPVYGGNGILGYSDKILLNHPTLILGRVGEYCGCAHLTEPNSWISDNALYAKECSSEVDLVFIKNCFEYMNLNQYSNKMGQPLITQGIIYEIKFGLPPLPEQRKIAHILNTVQKAIEQEDNLIRTTTELKKALMQKLFTEGTRGEPQKETEIGLVPESWEVIHLIDVCEKPQYGFTDSAAKEGNAQFLRITDITEFGVNWNEVPFCNCPDYKNYELKNGDIVFARIGATTGKSYLIKNPPKSVYASYLIRIRCKDEILPEFLINYFETEQYWSQINARKGDNLKGGVNGSILSKLFTPKPSLDEQEKIASIFIILDKKIAFALSKKQTLTALFKTLLHELMTGQRRVHELEFK
jgi:restriction endonuclease S subunit